MELGPPLLSFDYLKPAPANSVTKENDGSGVEVRIK
jgi:hypothetical protein